ncbi:MAG: FixH family protein [Actinomycetota bacterium]|nr:FixH family protein [Actinomycetota bacterium]
MRRVWRLAVVAAAAAVGFSLAVVRFGGAAEQGCAQRVARDPSYQVRWSEQPSSDVTRYRLSIRRDGQRITGADVCLNAYLRGMSAVAVADHGREVARGVYEVSLVFEMGGRWRGRVLVAEPGRRVVAVPLDLEVPSPEPGS